MEAQFIGQAVWYGLVNGTSYVVFSVGLTLIFGVMGVLNLAHGEIAMLGAMLAYALMTYLGLNYFLALPLSVILIGACGVIFNRVAILPLVSASPLSVLLSTIGLSYILLNGSAAIWGSDIYALDFPLKEVMQAGGIRISQESIMLLLLGAAGVVSVYFLLTKVRLGKCMRATSQNLIGANLVGINTNRVYDFTLVIASALAALGGVLIGTIWTASPYLGQRLLMKGFVIVIVGGMGNITGVIGVGLAIGILEAIFGVFVSPYFREAFIYGIMIVVLLLKPEGLFAGR